MVEVSPGSRAGLRAAMGAEAGLAERRLDRGCRAFTACRDSLPAAYGWVSAGPEWIGEARLEIRPGAGEAYLWNCVTLDAHRRQGLFRLLLVQVAALLQAEGLNRLWIADAGGPAVPALPAAGYRPALRVEEQRAAALRRVAGRPAPGAPAGLAEAARLRLGLGTPRWLPVPAARVH